MTSFKRFRKATEKRTLAAGLAEMEALLIREKDLFTHKVFTSQMTDGEANRRLLNLLKVFFLASDIAAFFSLSPSPQQAESTKTLATKMAASLKSCRSQTELHQALLNHLQLYFLGATAPEPKAEAPTQQSLFH